ncbi:MAG: hypothetical protein ABI461_09620 [Polyangiaceae bacterium]
MIRRLFVGLVLGALVGAIVAAALIKGLGVLAFGTLLALAAGAATGALVGLVAGKPIWAPGAKIEAGLKAGFGAALGVLGMFLVRKFLGELVDLSQFGAGVGTIGDLPATSLPLVAGVLGALYELDNTPETSDKKAGNAAPPAATNKRVRVETEEDEELEASAASKRAKR